MANSIRKFYLPCNCGCSILEYMEYEDYDDVNMVSLAFFERAYYAHSQPTKIAISRYLKRLWCAIIGKEYRLFEVILDNEQVEEFKKFINELPLTQVQTFEEAVIEKLKVENLALKQSLQIVEAEHDFAKKLAGDSLYTTTSSQ